MNARLRTVLAVALGLCALLLLHIAPPAALAASWGLHAVMGDTTSTTDLEAAMKVIFDDSIVNNVVVDNEVLDLFEEGGGIRTDQTTGGRYIETAQLFGLPAGFGFRTELGYIPVPRGPEIENSRINLKKAIGSVEISGDTLKRVRTDVGAFLNWGEQVMPKLVERINNELDHLMLGFGAGVKARVATVDAVNNRITVKDAFGVIGYPSGLYQFLAGESLRAAPQMDGTGIRAGNYIVKDVSHKDGWLQLDTVANLQADDFLAEGDQADNSFGTKTPNGLLGIVDDGDVLAVFQNIPRANFSAWRSLVVDAQAAPFNAGQKLTEDVITYADDECFQRGGGRVEILLTSRLGQRQLWRDLRGDRSINDPRSFTGGKGGIFMILGDRVVRIRVARKMPATVCFGLMKSHLRKWMLHNFEWDSTTGSMFRQVTDSTGRKDAFYAYGTLFLETGSDDPQKMFRIENFANVE